MQACPNRDVAPIAFPFPRKSIFRDLMSLKTQQMTVRRPKMHIKSQLKARTSNKSDQPYLRPMLARLPMLLIWT